ncbi:hypothetical protein Sjap_019827 [Stephania japonica]|uniref:Uncharacterized protein n=1 Tax=Stephania japonica TaxID=461633 RepID=A0AAP0F4T7_9MAGN
MGRRLKWAGISGANVVHRDIVVVKAFERLRTTDDDDDENVKETKLGFNKKQLPNRAIFVLAFSCYPCRDNGHRFQWEVM